MQMSRMPGYTIRRTCKHTHAYVRHTALRTLQGILTNTGDPNSSHGIESKILPSAQVGPLLAFLFPIHP